MVGCRAQQFPSNLYPYLDHNHQQRPMPTHAHPCYSKCAHVFKNCVMCITRLHQVLVGSDKWRSFTVVGFSLEHLLVSTFLASEKFDSDLELDAGMHKPNAPRAIWWGMCGGSFQLPPQENTQFSSGIPIHWQCWAHPCPPKTQWAWVGLGMGMGMGMGTQRRALVGCDKRGWIALRRLKINR
jgi:hypothetical protein